MLLLLFMTRPHLVPNCILTRASSCSWFWFNSAANGLKEQTLEQTDNIFTAFGWELGTRLHVRLALCPERSVPKFSQSGKSLLSPTICALDFSKHGELYSCTLLTFLFLQIDILAFYLEYVQSHTFCNLSVGLLSLTSV